MRDAGTGTGADGAVARIGLRSMKRLVVVDWLRSAAIVAMAAYHLGWDLQMFGFLPPGTTSSGWWPFAARSIASSFLFLAGLSLWLAHGRRFRAMSWARRMIVLVAAAAGVSLATWLFVPQAWVRFGILHSIALSGFISLAFLRAPWWLSAAGAAAILFVAPEFRSADFDGVWWLWSGLGLRPPPMIDYEPMVPWLAPFLAGLAFGQAGGTRLLAWGPARPGRIGRALAWPGKHALPVYLVHQPVLVATVAAAAWIAPHI